ncbi:hypothetical protein CBL_20314 [Carabus blaptoides fortunei]
MESNAFAVVSLRGLKYSRWYLSTLSTKKVLIEQPSTGLKAECFSLMVTGLLTRLARILCRHLVSTEEIDKGRKSPGSLVFCFLGMRGVAPFDVINLYQCPEREYGRARVIVIAGGSCGSSHVSGPAGDHPLLWRNLPCEDVNTQDVLNATPRDSRPLDLRSFVVETAPFFVAEVQRR